MSNQPNSEPQAKASPKKEDTRKGIPMVGAHPETRRIDSGKKAAQ